MFDKGDHNVEFQVPVNCGGGLGVEVRMGVEQNKWSKPSGKLSPQS